MKKEEKSKTNQKSLQQELFEFLATFETAAIGHATSESLPEGNDLWNEISVPMFRNFKVFVHQSGAELIIAIPTHLSNGGGGQACFHVIREIIADNEHNGTYEVMTAAEFSKAFQCVYINKVDSGMSPLRIGDLAEILTDKLPEIKKLKRSTLDERKISIKYFGKVILDFLMKNGIK